MVLRFGSDFDNALAWADELWRQVDRQYEGTPRSPWGRLSNSPHFHVLDTGTAFVVQGLVPGLSEKEIEIQATVNGITVRGERKVAALEGYRTHRQERGAYSFSRSFRLPTPADLEKATARVSEGVLTIELPKLPDALPKAIAVQGA